MHRNDRVTGIRTLANAFQQSREVELVITYAITTGHRGVTD